MSTLFIHTVGTCRLDLGGRIISPGSPLVRATLLTLAAHPRRRVSADVITRTLWQDWPPAAPASRVSGYINDLRRLLGDHAEKLRTHRSSGGGACSYELHITDDQLDMTRLRDATAAARARATAGDTTGAMTILERWLNAYPPEDDALPHTPNLTAIRQRIEVLCADAVALYARWCLDQGHLPGIERHVVPYLMRCPTNKQLQAVWTETIRVYYAHSSPSPAWHACCLHPRAHRHGPSTAPAWLTGCTATPPDPDTAAPRRRFGPRNSAALTGRRPTRNT